MRKLLRTILLKPVLWATEKFSSRPDRKRIFEALSALLSTILNDPGKRGLIIPFEEQAGKFIIFSDQHKGARNGADDFMLAEPNYLAALEYYYKNDFVYINLGDSEELWENRLTMVKKYNTATFEAEKKFLQKKAFIKIFGNHDLYWDNDPLAWMQLKSIYGEKLKVYEGVILQTTVNGPQSTAGTQQSTAGQQNITNSSQQLSGENTPPTTHHSPLTIFLTHGHQGDASSDGNWFSKFFVADIWGPLQAFLRINPNTPANDAVKKTLHNVMMYEWSSQQKKILLITGHTHQPVFESLTHLERLYRQLEAAKKQNNDALISETEKQIREMEPHFMEVNADYTGTKPSYFNSGCCCFSDGDITGIEIAEGYIRLIKWEKKNEISQREVLEEMSLNEVAEQL
jgi:UDP-2,3-diacylglucosamine pyrophosphatase LpxH